MNYIPKICEMLGYEPEESANGQAKEGEQRNETTNFKFRKI